MKEQKRQIFTVEHFLRGYEEGLKKQGARPDDELFLPALKGLEKASGSATLFETALRLGVTQEQAKRVLDRLRERKLVEEEGEGADAVTRLTPKGKEFLTSL